jgi:hypothetical protein
VVLFPEKIGGPYSGRYFRLDRPFPIYSRGLAERFDIHHATLQPEPMTRTVHWRTTPQAHEHEH